MLHNLNGRRHHRTERGAAAVEFALVMPFLMMILIGTITTGLSYSHAIGETNSVREGARFGATSVGPTVGGVVVMTNWASDVISRVRATQFDDPGPTFQTAICVQLWKVTAPNAGTNLFSSCSGGAGVTTPTIPNSATANPKVPLTVPVGGCVVRVISGRKFSINPVIAPALTRTATRFAVARYERTETYTACK